MEPTGLTSLSWVRPVVDFVFPPLCLGCGEYEEQRGPVCATCRHRIDVVDHPICLACLESLPEVDSCPICGDESLVLYAYGHYQEPLDQIVIQFKFHGITHVAGIFGRLLVEKYLSRLQSLSADYLLPVPLHPGRENRRGYNQAALLARELSAGLDIPVAEDRLRRVHRRRPQSRMRRVKRAENVKGVFRCDIPGIGERVLLVDDVVTSGSTAAEAQRVLQESGYRVIGVIAIAHGG